MKTIDFLERIVEDVKHLQNEDGLIVFEPVGIPLGENDGEIWAISGDAKYLAVRISDSSDAFRTCYFSETVIDWVIDQLRDLRYINDNKKGE